MKRRLLPAAALVFAFCVPHAPAQTTTAESQFRQARTLLTGANKNEPEAKTLLLQATADASLSATSRCYAYVYLGYIEDRAGHRDDAVGWYTKALQIQIVDGILDVAKTGLTQPVTWIRHLDEGSSPPPPAPPLVSKIGNGYLTTVAPEGLTLAPALSPDQWRENFDILWQAIDRAYACFKLKSIDWPAVRVQYEERLRSVGTTDDFYFLLFHLVNELQDSHASIQNYRPPAPSTGPGISVDLFGGKPFVTAVAPASEAAAAGVQAGSEVLEVDGLAVEARMEALRPYLRGFSSERAFQRQAAWNLLSGDPGTAVSITLRAPAGATQTVTLRRTYPVGSRPALRSLSFELTRQRFVHFGRHASGIGYIQIESFNGREEIADEFDAALETLRDTPGLIIDIRDNTGGYGAAHARIVGRFLNARALGGISYTKRAPDYKDLTRRDLYFAPGGNWQYTRPVALLINDVTGSASDLFTCNIRSVPGLVTIGSTTHGNSSGVATFAVLPCGAVVRISNGYIADAQDRPIEKNGTTPDIPVTPTVFDFLNGADPVLDTAVAVLSAR